MGRYYRLTPKITDDMSAEEDYSFVMTRALNICRRIGKGCEISFTRFAVEDLEASM